MSQENKGLFNVFVVILCGGGVVLRTLSRSDNFLLACVRGAPEVAQMGRGARAVDPALDVARAGGKNGDEVDKILLELLEEGGQYTAEEAFKGGSSQSEASRGKSDFNPSIPTSRNFLSGTWYANINTSDGTVVKIIRSPSHDVSKIQLEYVIKDPAGRAEVPQRTYQRDAHEMISSKGWCVTLINNKEIKIPEEVAHLTHDFCLPILKKDATRLFVKDKEQTRVWKKVKE